LTQVRAESNERQRQSPDAFSIGFLRPRKLIKGISDERTQSAVRDRRFAQGASGPFTAEEFWSLREAMTVHVLVAPDEMVEGILKCGHASGSLLSFVKGLRLEFLLRSVARGTNRQ
jgi:hypothetical protein